MFLNGPNPNSFCLFSFFSHDKYSTNLTINDKSVDGVPVTRTQGGRMQIWARRIGEASPISIPICQKIGEASPTFKISEAIRGKSRPISTLPDFWPKVGESRDSLEFSRFQAKKSGRVEIWPQFIPTFIPTFRGNLPKKSGIVEIWPRFIPTFIPTFRGGSGSPISMQNRDRDKKKSRSRFLVEIGEASPIDLAHPWFTHNKNCKLKRDLNSDRQKRKEVR